ncbi:Nuclease-related domain-containing protein [Methanococcoides vulcani]|uniref:Nuclease-related domain-containing protein n=1 Tax=Methanococcoides vulcani TaxID=1353158 RepID=A0A1I0B8N8_9EURY|nr:BREX system ATP-binding domain-containing protein [Methanococcoides vulcani]SET02510.1 Nuclease-related domain-containing protein [Methanococcoides vulcani]
MSVKLFYGKKTDFEHEYKQLKEIINIIQKEYEEDMYILTNVLVSNGEIDCILLTKKGPVILETKNYEGEIIGSENGDWIVKTPDEVNLNKNLFQQLKSHRTDLFSKLEKIREEHFPRIEEKDLWKINSWGYFKKGSCYPDGQINKDAVKWFDIVTAENLMKKLGSIYSGYTLFTTDMDEIVAGLNLSEWTEDISDKSEELNKEPVRQEALLDASRDVKTVEIIDLIDQMSENGTAPEDGCTLFGIGNDEYIQRIKEVYLEKRFRRKGSSEKFVVGPFGSGKSHFINQLTEVARGIGCVTSTVALTKDVDVTSNFSIYREVARQIRPPDKNAGKGIKNLMISCWKRIEEATLDQCHQSEEQASNLLRYWVDGLEQSDFELDMFGRVAFQAFDAYLKQDNDKFDNACRWMGGEIDNKAIAKQLNVPPMTKKDLNLTASQINLSLYKLITKAGFSGTVVAFDEAEQGFDIGKTKKSQLFSLLQSDINSVNKLKGGSVLVLYAITPNILEEMMNFPALQQRVQDPGKNMSFENGYTRVTTINIRRPENMSKDEIINELKAMGNKLVDLFYSSVGSEINVPKDDVFKNIGTLAVRCVEDDISISDRRQMIKATCNLLMNLYDTGILKIPEITDIPISSGFDDEV